MSCEDIGSDYSPNSLVRAFHDIPHVDIDLDSSPDQFETTSEYLEVSGTRACEITQCHVYDYNIQLVCKWALFRPRLIEVTAMRVRDCTAGLQAAARPKNEGVT